MFEKHDDYTIKEITTQERFINIPELLVLRVRLMEERDSIDYRIGIIDKTISEAKKLGVKTIITSGGTPSLNEE